MDRIDISHVCAVVGLAINPFAILLLLSAIRYLRLVGITLNGLSDLSHLSISVVFSSGSSWHGALLLFPVDRVGDEYWEEISIVDDGPFILCVDCKEQQC